MRGFYGPFCDGFFGFGRTPFGGFMMMGLGLVLVLALAYFIFRRGGVLPPSGESESPLDLLQKRYVNGEISQDEYLEKKDILNKK